jgi:hypothetical protein
MSPHSDDDDLDYNLEGGPTKFHMQPLRIPKCPSNVPIVVLFRYGSVRLDNLDDVTIDPETGRVVDVNGDNE